MYICLIFTFYFLLIAFYFIIINILYFIYDDNDMIERTESETVHHCPIIISDLLTAIMLLKLYPNDYVVYLDGKIFSYSIKIIW